MLEGEFVHSDGSPFIRGDIWIPRFDLRRTIHFCLDTGTTYTTLTPRDAVAIGIDYTLLEDVIEVAMVGGATPTFLEPVEISFTDFDARTAHSYRVMLAIVPPSAETAAMPSLLGRDVINRWRIDYHPTARQLHCEVITADATIDLHAS